jgi:peptide/nickel transport system ATP-binding protein
VTVLIDQQAGEGSQGTPTAFLDVRDLRVHFPTDDGLVKSVDGISFTLNRGSTLGIVGESGCGKSVTSQAILGLHKGTKAQLSGQIWLDGVELIAADAEDVRKLRGNKMAMIFQDPLSSLHPFYSVGDQIVEAYRVHNHVSKKAAWTRTIEMLDRVGIPNAAGRAKDYPHQFSGGMRQRAMIAMALVNDPELLIADEPTTALDVTVQAQIIELMVDLQKEFGSAIIIITHDLGVVAEIAKDVMVMYAGRGAEYSQADDIFYRPEHPYAWGLLSSVTRLDRVREDRLRPIPGSPPSLLNVPSGCPFSPRCTYRNRNGIPCQTVRPDLEVSEGKHLVSCHLPVADRRQAFITDIKPNL